MRKPKWGRTGGRNWSVAEVFRLLTADFVNPETATASRCQGCRRVRSSTPGEIVFVESGHSLRSLSHQQVRTFQRRDPILSRQGYAPAPLRAPRPLSARTPRDAERSCGRIHVTPINTVHSVRDAFSGTCFSNSVACRLGTFCFCSPKHHDAMDFVGPPFPGRASHGGNGEIGWTLASSPEGGFQPENATLSPHARLESGTRWQLCPGCRDSSRHAASVCVSGFSTSNRGEAWTLARFDIDRLILSKGMDAPGRHPEDGSVQSAPRRTLRECRSFTGPSHSLHNPSHTKYARSYR